MTEAMEEAKATFQEGGKPFGAILVRDGKIISRGRNRTVQTGDPTAHAEIDCIKNAGLLDSYADTILYSTMMPCLMCSGAVVRFGIPKVVVAEARSLPVDASLLQARGVEVIVLDIDEAVTLMERSKAERPEAWK